jgi:signal peptidase I
MSELPVLALGLVAILLIVTPLLGVWVTIDAARRGCRWVAWMWATAILGVLPVLGWLVVRRRRPVLQDARRPTTLQLWGIAFPIHILLFFALPQISDSYWQVARVEGQAMSPTLRDQDRLRLLVNKIVYRFDVPRRGDVVMLRYPVDPDKNFVKRVIAEPGDVVEIVNGRVTVNDEPLDEPYVAEEAKSRDTRTPQRISEGYYFVMGDRRNNSSDSRHWGLVPQKYIVGRVALRWWPFSDYRTDFGATSAPTTKSAAR